MQNFFSGGFNEIANSQIPKEIIKYIRSMYKEHKQIKQGESLKIHPFTADYYTTL